MQYQNLYYEFIVEYLQTGLVVFLLNPDNLVKDDAL